MRIHRRHLVTACFMFVIRYSSAFAAHSPKGFRFWNPLVRTHQRGSLTRTFMASSSSSSSAPPSTGATISPPPAKREEDRIVLAGVAPPGWDPDIPRQSETSTEALLDPPVPIPDPYGWMRDDKRENTEVLDHLKAENAYTEAMTEHLKPLRENLYTEMLSLIQETDYTLPRPHGDYFYYSRTIEGKSYSLICRAPKTSEKLPQIEWDKSIESPILPGEHVILDVNKLAEGKSYCATGAIAKSPSQKLLAYSTDFTGGETCQMFIKDIKTEEIVDHDPSLEIDGSIVWGVDDSTVFYLKMDAAHRPFQAYRRHINSEQPDELLFQEDDELFWMGISKSLDGKYFFLEVASKETSEVHFLDLQNSEASLQCVAKRRPKVLYEVEHRNGKWWIQSNVGGLPNLALFVAPAEEGCEGSWELVKGTSGEVLFEGDYDRSLDYVECFARHVVAGGREGGIPRVWVIGLTEDDTVSKFERLNFEEEAYDVGLGAHYEFDTDTVVVSYDSMVTPTQSLEISLDDTSNRTVLKERSVPGYDKARFGCDRLVVKSRDGKTHIPISMVYRRDVMEKNLENNEPVHVHLYGYGSYGACMEADFSITRLPLLERGVVYVIAHVRGGGEMGRQWYEEPNGGKYLCKKNTFNDFVDVARWLIEDRKLTTAEQMSCEGRSAGGLLIGSSINQAPELFKVAVLGVPFVDVVTTMTDASIPLTAIEFEEWGCPNEKKFFEYMMEYSPMQNVKAAKYPACLLTAGLHDPRVQYWEPSKLAAELRHSQADGSGPVCLKMDMSAGHFSASDRYKYLRELAFDYAFLLEQLGIES